MKPGLAVEKLFRDTLKAAGKFAYVVSTKIDKSTQNCPHYFLAYATKDRAGLKAFREIEYRALREHERARSGPCAQARDQERHPKLFAEFDANYREASIDEIVAEQKQLAKGSEDDERSCITAVHRGSRRAYAGLYAARDKPQGRLRRACA